jgi:hypothetical protein
MVKDNVTWQPKWVPLSILDFARIVHNFGNDNDSLANWVRKMAEDLLFCNIDSEDELTKDMLTTANEKYSAKSEAGKKGGKASAKARKQKQKSQEVAGNGNAPDESGNGLEEFNDQETASGNYQVPDKESTNNGDSARREAAGGETDGNVAVARTTTVSNPLALDMPGLDKCRQNAKTRDNSSSCRHASPSCSPEDGTNAAQPDSPANDQSDRHKRGREEPATDADIRKDSENMTDAGNGGALESRTSAAGDSFEALVMPSPGEGRKTLSAGSSHPAGNTPPQFVINHNQRHRPQKPQANSPPRSSEDVRLFALDRNLDIDDARMWYQMNFVDRPGCDKDGVAINNWKGHCTAYCKAEAERRKAG